MDLVRWVDYIEHFKPVFIKRGHSRYSTVNHHKDDQIKSGNVCFVCISSTWAYLTWLLEPKPKPELIVWLNPSQKCFFRCYTHSGLFNIPNLSFPGDDREGRRNFFLWAKLLMFTHTYWRILEGPGKVAPLCWLRKQRIRGKCCFVVSLRESLPLRPYTITNWGSTLTSITSGGWFRSLLQQVPSAPSAPIQRQSIFLWRQGKVGACWLVSVSHCLRSGHSGTTRGLFLHPPLPLFPSSLFSLHRLRHNSIHETRACPLWTAEKAAAIIGPLRAWRKRKFWEIFVTQKTASVSPQASSGALIFLFEMNWCYLQRL